MRNLTTDEAAARIQNAWRTYRGKEMAEIDKMLACLTTRLEEEPKLDAILRSNDALITRLTSLRRSRAYETMKYEQIVNMPSGNVSAYLKTESNRSETDKTLYSSSERTQHAEQERLEDEAARRIQRFLRENVKRRQEARVKQHWTEFEGSERVKLLGKVAERLGGKYVLRRTDLETVRFKIASKDSNLDRDVSVFAKRARMIESLRTNMDKVREIRDLHSLVKVGSSMEKTPLGGKHGTLKGQQLFEQRMERLQVESMQDELDGLK